MSFSQASSRREMFTRFACHLYSNVPTFNVPRAHEWLLANVPDFRDVYIERPGYVMTAMLYFMGRPFPGRGAVGDQ